MCQAGCTAFGCMLTSMPRSRIVQIFKSPEVSLAWLVAMGADAAQILLLPFFIEGGLSPADTLVDVVTALILSRLLGWHWAFLPSFLAELVPGLDLFPTWSAAMAYVTWQRARSAPDIIDIEPTSGARIKHTT